MLASDSFYSFYLETRQEKSIEGTISDSFAWDVYTQ